MNNFIVANDRSVAIVELAIAAAVVASANIFQIVPISETPWLLLIGFGSLRLRKLKWRDIGLTRPDSWIRTLVLAILAGIALQVISEFAIEPLIKHFTGRTADLSSFRGLVGNLPTTLIMLAVVWTLAAFGEEIVYRGYLLERAAGLAGHSRKAYLTGMIAMSIAFGIGHYYQGPAGVIGSTFSGLFFGTLFLVSGPNLWLPILTHGFSDTIALGLIYGGYVKDL